MKTPAISAASEISSRTNPFEKATITERATTPISVQSSQFHAPMRKASRPPMPLVECASVQKTVSLAIFFSSLLHHFMRKRGWGRLFVPADRKEVVTDKLFIKRRLRPVGHEAGLGPEARRIRSQHFVNQDDLAARNAPLELGVCNDNTAAFGVFARFDIKRHTPGPQLFRRVLTDRYNGLLPGDVLVVPFLRFGGRSKDGLLEFRGFLEAGGQPDAANGAGGTVIIPP